MKRLLLLVMMASLGLAAHAAPNPNIIYILADDMGYGNVHCLNPKRGKINTPHMDRLAPEGMIFTDAHTSSSVCTPSRYGILTGRYNWRSRLQDGVLNGYSEALIDADRPTVAGFLKNLAHNTACFGKWHLGMLMPTTNGELPDTRRPRKTNVVWDGVIKDSPVTRGFDTFYGISASLDIIPDIWIYKNLYLAAVDNNSPQKPAPGFSKEQVLPTIGRKTVEYIQQQDASRSAGSGQAKPFFVYVPLTSPHTPIVSTQEWKGKSGLGTYGDFVMQTDHVIGQIMKAVDDSEFADNTIVIVTEDNGCSRAVSRKEGLAALEKQGHYPSAQFRGSKADLWDGGHRVPFIVRWPNGIKAGSQSDQTICLTDVMATCADLTGAKLPKNVGEDSVSFAPALKGEPIVSTRKGVIHHSISGHFAYRQGKWKLLLAKGSGGWTAPNEGTAAQNGAPIAQLYDMENDPGETTNLYVSQPEVAARLLAQLEADIVRGCSTDGVAARNDFNQIELWKSGQR